MKKSRLIAHFKLLTTEEFKRFYAYLRSPYFTHSKDVIRLFELIRKYYPSFLSDHLKKESIFKKLFPNEAYKDIKIRNLQSKLNKVVENYLIQIDYEQNEFKKKKKLTQIYGQRNYYTAYKKGTKDLLEELEALPYRDADYYYEKYLLEKKYYFHINTSKEDDIAQILKRSIKHLEYFYGLERLFLGIDLKNRTHIFSEQHDFSPIIDSINIPEENILNKQFQQIFRLMENDEIDTFHQLFILFKNHIDNIRPYYNKVILIILLNKALKLVKQEEGLFLNKLFELYKIGITKKLLFEDDKIPVGIFFNAVMISAKLKAFEWAEQFVEQYQNYLIINKEKEIIIQLAISNIRFHQGQYETVIHLLSTINPFNIRFELNIRTLMIRAYFMLMLIDDSYYFLLINQCHAFDKFLLRDKKFDAHKVQGNKQFIKIVQNIANLLLAQQFSPLKKIEFQTKIKRKKHMPHKNWLLEILNLKNK